MEKDVRWNTFFEDNHRYADIINGLGCEGQQIVSGEDLVEVDTRAGSKTRDLIRKAALGMNFAIIGIENQDEADYELPVRIMNYDAVHYKKQVSKISKKVKAAAKGLEPGEYMYGFRKDSRLFPVVTFVLYAGVEPWKGAEYLHDIIDFTDIPAALKRMVQNYKVQIIDIRRLKDTSIFKTDVRQVFDFIRCAEDWDALLKLVNGDVYYQNMDEEAYEVIIKYANLTEEAVKMSKYRGEDGGVNVCKGIRDLMENSKAEGMEQKCKEIIIKMLKRGMPIADICEFVECDAEYVEQIRQAM